MDSRFSINYLHQITKQIAFLFYAISDLLPQGIIFKQWRRGVSLFGSPGHLDLAESARGNRMRIWKPERKVKLKQRKC